jgi:predicted Ser/Thr protein kinase
MSEEDETAEFPEPLRGRVGDRYDIVKPIGKGAMGEVYHARDKTLERDVALKVMRSGDYPRFEREAKILGKINHPNVVTAHDYARHTDGRPFIVMELLKGRDLERLLLETPCLPAPRAANVVQQVLTGLAVAHKQGVVHRDIKPANVFVTEDERVKIMDFGLALLSLGAPLTVAGKLVGTPLYMSPEQVRGETVDRRSDVFSVASLLCRLLTGRPPFGSGSEAVHVIITRILHEDPELSLPPGCERLLPVLRKALAKHAADRYQSADEFAAAIAAGLAARATAPSGADPVEGHAEPPSGTAAPSPRDDRVLVRIISVSYRRDAAGRAELVYEPRPWAPGEVVPAPQLVNIDPAKIERRIAAIEAEVKELTSRALYGRAVSSRALETAASALASDVLPRGGLVDLLPAGGHPQLSIIRDPAAEIPWEVLEETFFACESCGQRMVRPEPATTAQPFCGRCGAAMSRSGGKLALTYRLTHRISGAGPAAAKGREFLLVEDPQGDLTDAKVDPAGLCASHFDELSRLLSARGYVVDRLTGREATRKRFLSYLESPGVVGLYYLGHGSLPDDGNNGRLELADGPVDAAEIQERRPRIPFVYLNACEGAIGSRRNWDLAREHLSVAEALSQGPAKVVIAPLWPVVNIQAAEMALDFFRHAAGGASCGAALTEARRRSLTEYQAGRPHLGWCSYRFFGDPNSLLPVPAEIREPPPPSRQRVFLPRLNREVFGFQTIDDVLSCAVERRARENRAQLNTDDLRAGLAGRGDLTRTLLRDLGLDPDVVGRCEEAAAPVAEPAPVVAAVLRSPDAPSPADRAAAGVARRLAAELVRDDFDEDAAELLLAADRTAVARDSPVDRRISERDLLEVVLRKGAWSDALPPLEQCLERLRRLTEDGRLYTDGQIRLRGLDPAARRVIETAHALAQQMGISPITENLVLGAFFGERDGFAEQVLRQGSEALPELLFRLFRMQDPGEASARKPVPASFGLSMEVCERVVWPMLERARERAAGGIVDRATLFSAFLEGLALTAPAREPPLPPPQRMVGRDDLLERIEKAVTAAEPARICLRGPVQVGRSALTHGVLHSGPVKEFFGARRHLVPCDRLNTRAAVADAVGVSLGLGTRDEASMLSLLAAQPTLLVLDGIANAWAQDGPALEELLSRLSALGGLRLVVTIRGRQHPVRVPWSEVLDVPPLDAESRRVLFESIRGRAFAQDDRLKPLLDVSGGLPLVIEVLATLAQGQPDLETLWLLWAQDADVLSKLDEGFRGALEDPRVRASPEARSLLGVLARLPDGIDRKELRGLVPELLWARGEMALLHAGLAVVEGNRLRLSAPLRQWSRTRIEPDAAVLSNVRAHFVDRAAQLRIASRVDAEARTWLQSEADNVVAMAALALESVDAAARARALDALSILEAAGCTRALSMLPALHSAFRAPEAARDSSRLHELGSQLRHTLRAVAGSELRLRPMAASEKESLGFFAAELHRRAAEAADPVERADLLQAESDAHFLLRNDELALECLSEAKQSLAETDTKADEKFLAIIHEAEARLGREQERLERSFEAQRTVLLAGRRRLTLADRRQVDGRRLSL